MLDGFSNEIGVCDKFVYDLGQRATCEATAFSSG